MEHNDNGGFFSGMMAGAVIMTIIFAFIAMMADAVSRELIVKKGHAHYNSETAEFEWNEPCGDGFENKN